MMECFAIPSRHDEHGCSIDLGGGKRLEILTLDPELAEKWLSRNTKNRPLSQEHVQRIVSDLKHGKYEFIGDTFVIGESGTLLDGQHRAEAVRRSGIPIEHALVLFGIPDRMFVRMGRVKTRLASDVMAASKEFRYPAPVSSVATLCMRYELRSDHSMGNHKHSSIRPDTVLEFGRQNRGMDDSARVAKSLSKHIKHWMPALHLAFLHYGAQKYGSGTLEQANEFAHKVATGDMVSARSGIALYRDRLLRNKEDVAKLHRDIRIALGIKAWNSFFEGTEVGVLRFTEAEKFPSFA